jgi:RNA polymerase sigma-70 factor (ECF subfamily)
MQDEPHCKSLSNILAFNTLFKEYSGRLYRFAFGYLKTEAESEELVQEVFTRIWEKRNDLKEELSFKSYLFTISFNIIRKHFRTKAYFSEYLQSKVYEEHDIRTSQEINYDSLFQYVKKLADKLPERRKEIFTMSRFDGQNINEIAEQLRISHKTVENQLTEALKYIRKNLKRENIPFVLFYILFII